MNIGVYGQVWRALVPRNEGVPLAECDFMAVWTLHPMFQQYRLPGSKGYLVHTCYIPSVVEWILAYMAKFGCLGSQKRRRPSGRLWFYGSLDEYWRIWPSLRCLGSQKRRRPSGRLWIYGSLDPATYVPAISAPWVKGLFGTHMLHTLCCGMNIGVYGQVWDALVPRNEGVPLADYDFMAVWSLHPIYQQCRLPESKGYLVHTCYIPSVVEWILAYMAKFGVPWFPETKTSLWQIVILWQSGPWTPCTSNIGSKGQRAIWYTHVTYPLLWNEYWRIWPILGCLGSQERRRPSGRLWFFGSLDPAPYVPAISAPWVKGLFGTHMLHTLSCGMNIGVYDQVWDALVPRIEGVPLADYDFMTVWSLHPMYKQYRLPGSKGYLVHTCYIPSVVEWILAYMAKFGVPWLPETKASLWQIVILWQFWPCYLCTSNIGSLGQRAIWDTHVTYPLLWNEYWRIWPSLGCLDSHKRRRPSGRLWFYGSMDPAPYVPAMSGPWVKGLFGTHMLHTLCCGMNIGVYGQVWGALVPRKEGVPLANCDFTAVWTLHPICQQYRLPGSKGYLVHTFYIPSVVEWILAYLAKFGVPWFPETKASLWQIWILWQSGPCTLCSSNIGSLGQRAIWYTHVTNPLFWNEYWRIWPSLVCLGSQKRRRPSGRLWSCGSLDPASNLPAISTLWLKGLFGTHMLHSLCCGINVDVSGQVWGALVPRNECVPLADYDFMAVWTLHPMYQQYRLPGSKGYLIHTCYIPSVVEWILAYMAKFGVPWFPETKAFLWQIVTLRHSGPCTLCTSNIGSLGQRTILYTHVTYPLLWNEYWRIWPSLGCLGSQKRRRSSGRLWFYGSLVPAPYVPAISAPWVKGLFDTHMLHTRCCGMNIGVYGQVWDALVPRNEGVPLADCDFMAVCTLHPMYQ